MPINEEKSAQILKALGHPVRLRIVCGLLKGENNCNVTKIVQNLNIP